MVSRHAVEIFKTRVDTHMSNKGIRSWLSMVSDAGIPNKHGYIHTVFDCTRLTVVTRNDAIVTVLLGHCKKRRRKR